MPLPLLCARSRHAAARRNGHYQAPAQAEVAGQARHRCRSWRVSGPCFACYAPHHLRALTDCGACILYYSAGAAGQQQERAAAQTAIMAHPSDEELRSAVQDICESKNAWAPREWSWWCGCAGRWCPVEIVNAGLRGKTGKAATALNLPLAQLSCSTPGAACMCVAQV